MEEFAFVVTPWTKKKKMNLDLSTYKTWIVVSYKCSKCFSTDGDPISVLSVRVKIFKSTGYKYSPEKF